MLPIYVCFDSEIDAFESRCITEAIDDVKRLFPNRQIVSFGSRAWSTGDYSSADWYINKAKLVLRHGGIVQLNAGSILDLLCSEPWQKNTPHIDILFTSRDLTVGELNFCFGLARGRTTVQSVYRYRSLNDTERRLAIKAVLHHELGHILGCASYGRAHTEMNLGSHCTNHGCIMRQGLSTNVWVQHALDARRAGQIYCPECLAEARLSSI